MKNSNLNQFKTGFVEGFLDFASCIGTLINSTLLTLVYFLGIGPTSIIAKPTGKKFLDTETDNQKKSYWESSEAGKEKKESYYRQF